MFAQGKRDRSHRRRVRYRPPVAIQRKSTKPVGVTNEAGEPEIVIDLGGLTLSMTPPKTKAERDRDEAEAAARAADEA